MSPTPSRTVKRPILAPAAASFVLVVLVVATIAGMSFAFANGQSAQAVLGQGTFTTGSSATSAAGLWGPKDLVLDRSGNLWVSDSNNNRVVEYLLGGGFTSGQSASTVIGQSQINSGNSGNTASGLANPAGLAFDSAANLWVADSLNNRILEFLAPLFSGEPASVVLGQVDFLHTSPSTTASGLSSPQGLAFDPAGNLWVTDQKNNRVLRYAAPFASGESASSVIGQPDFAQSAATTTASGLIGPTALTFDPTGNMWVVDQGNNRVLEYGRPLSTGESASVALGQTGLNSSSSGTSSSLLWSPARVALDASGNLWVSELTNNRVTEFSPPFATGMTATLVIGQLSFGSRNAATSASGLQSPSGLTFETSGNLLVADYGNNRVLEYAGPPLTSTSSTTSTSSSTTTTSTVFTTVTSTTTVSTTATTTATVSSTYTSTAVVTSTGTSITTSTTTVTSSQTLTATTTSVATSTQTVSTTQTTTQTLTVTSTYTPSTTASSTASSGASSSTGATGGSAGSNWLFIAAGAVIAALLVLLVLLFISKRTRLLRRGKPVKRPSSWA